jgi:hypothetical protein
MFVLRLCDAKRDPSKTVPAIIMASANKIINPTSVAYLLKTSTMAEAPLGIALKRTAKSKS